MATLQKTNRKKTRKARFYKRKGFWWTLLIVLLLGLAAGGAGYMYAEDYTREYRVRAETYDLERINDLEIPSLIVDRNGKEIGRIFVQNRSVIPIDKVPKIFIDALRAGEDQRFETHEGVDYIGVIRALYLNWKAHETTQGASTITQQLARNAYDLKGEAQEMRRDRPSARLSRCSSPGGSRSATRRRRSSSFTSTGFISAAAIYGIRSAALGYFGKEPHGPHRTGKRGHRRQHQEPVPTCRRSTIRKTTARSRNLVLGRMVDLKALTRQEAARLATARWCSIPSRCGAAPPISTSASPKPSAGRSARTRWPPAASPCTPRSWRKRRKRRRKSLLESLARAESRPGYRRQKYEDYRKNSAKPAEYLQGAVLMVDHETGEVLAHVGGRDYAQVPYDFIELGKRPLGTAFFPFLYAAGLEHGLTPATLVEDEPMDNRSVMVGGREGILGEWGMEVSAPVYEGKIPARKALEHSKIAATVRFADQTGLQRVVQYRLCLRACRCKRRNCCAAWRWALRRFP